MKCQLLLYVKEDLMNSDMGVGMCIDIQRNEEDLFHTREISQISLSWQNNYKGHGKKKV